MNIHDATPFFNLQQPLSMEGVGMLVLDFQDAALPDNHQIIRFPASYSGTQEPMILTAALLQLGQQQVARAMPAEPTQIDQVETAVVRAVLYKDQCTIPWQSLGTKPVKTILELEHFACLTSGNLLDVWDRQTLSKQFQKVKHEEADLFSVVLRIHASCLDKLMQFNSKDGMYFEPRTQSGRSPCPHHRVIWLPKQSFHDTMIAKQATSIATQIARTGDRYGLRTDVSAAADVHQQHRPEVAYLDNSNTKTFRIAPLPFGSTKQSIQKVFDTWEWPARPSHTQGLTPDKTGLVWIAHATEQPAFFIFTMQHGDVLISEVAPTKQVAPQNPGVPLASAKTLRHLSAIAAKHQDHTSVDPLQVNDPWADAYKGHISKPNSITPSQLASIENNVEKWLRATMQPGPSLTKPDDAPMDAAVDERVSSLESRVSALTDNLNHLTGSLSFFQQQQQTHNTQVVRQVQALQVQADQQEHAMASMLDQKLEEQMSKIEALLTNKRTKVAAE